MYTLTPAVTSATTNTNDVSAVVDALYRFGLGQDLRYEQGSRELFESAFTADAVLDFRPAAAACRLEVPLMQGRDMITSIILNPATRIDTTHVVTNPRVQVNGDAATMTALVEAQHLPTVDHNRHALLKNIFTVSAARDGDLWRISYLLIRNIWHTGDPNVITGN